MSRHRMFVMLAAPILALGIVATSCGDDEEEQPTTTVGIANPASVYCESQGGTVDIVDEEGGQVGYCVLPDGSRIEEWEFYRQSSESSGDTGLANPAAVFCEEQGGTTSGPEPMCELPDGSVVDAWEYFRQNNG